VDNATAAILLTVVVHVVGLTVLVWLALGGERVDWRGWWPGDGGGGEPRAGGPVGPGGGVPLEDALPAAVRLRTEHERLSGSWDVGRRPAHAPRPARTREPA
jgi:hypothetical protein